MPRSKRGRRVARSVAPVLTRTERRAVRFILGYPSYRSSDLVEAAIDTIRPGMDPLVRSLIKEFKALASEIQIRQLRMRALASCPAGDRYFVNAPWIGRKP